jgi:hypothetical protein
MAGSAMRAGPLSKPEERPDNVSDAPPSRQTQFSVLDCGSWDRVEAP